MHNLKNWLLKNHMLTKVIVYPSVINVKSPNKISPINVFLIDHTSQVYLGLHSFTQVYLGLPSFTQVYLGLSRFIQMVCYLGLPTLPNVSMYKFIFVSDKLEERPRDAEEPLLPGGAQSGQLTQKGMEQCHRLGKRIRFLNFPKAG